MQLDESQKNLRVFSSEKISMLNENHLFELLELTKATDEEQNEFLDPSLVEYIGRQAYLSRPPSDVSGLNEDVEEGTILAET